MKIATWNVNSLRARLPRVLEWLEATEVDVVLLQETKMANTAFDPAPFTELGYEAAHHGDGQWNGVAILSRCGIEGVDSGFGDPQVEAGCRILHATCGGVRVSSVYVPNGRALDDPHYAVKLRWLEHLRTWLDDASAANAPHVIGGDFNIAPSDADVWDPAALVGMTHVSAAERAALAALCGLGYEDVVEHLHPQAGQFSWWDYRGGSFRQNHGMRIDLLLASAPLMGRLVAASVDREARKGEKPSDHAPVVATFSD